MEPETLDTADKAAPEAATEVITEEAPQAPSTEKKYTRLEQLQYRKGKIEAQIAEELAQQGEVPKEHPAIALADTIEDPLERDEVIETLQTRIKPSGNPEEDLKIAKSLVNATKTERLLEEQARKATPATHASRPGAPGKVEETFIPTAEEQIFMRKYNLTEEEIKKARQKQAQ